MVLIRIWLLAVMAAMSLCPEGALAQPPGAPATSNTQEFSRSNGARSLVGRVGPEFSDAYADVNGVKLHYVSGGSGMPVLLIPGWLETWYEWRDVMPTLVKTGFQVIAVDPRGMGESSRPTTGYDTATVATDLNALMMALGHKRYLVVGHDIGMWIGYALASDYADSVERLAILEATIPGLLKPEPLVFMPQARGAFFWHFMFNQQPDLPEILIQGRERAFMAYLLHYRAYKPETIPLDIYAEVYSTPGALRPQFEYYRALPATIEQNQKRAEHKLIMPVLALGGDHGVRDIPQTMLRPVTVNFRGGVLENCGHFAPEECPKELLDQLVPFLKGQDLAGGTR